MISVYPKTDQFDKQKKKYITYIHIYIPSTTLGSGGVWGSGGHSANGGVREKEEIQAGARQMDRGGEHSGEKGQQDQRWEAGRVKPRVFGHLTGQHSWSPWQGSG